MQTIIIQDENEEKWEALKAFMKALKIKFTISKSVKNYNPEFVKEVLTSEKEIKEGQSLTLSSEEFDKLWK